MTLAIDPRRPQPAAGPCFLSVRMGRRTASLLATLAAALLALPVARTARAAEMAPDGLVQFSTTASTEVTQDLLAITLQVVRDGPDAALVQAQLKTVLDAALAEARKAAAPGAMEVRTGNFALYPRYAKDNRINGWQGQAELVLQGRDSQRVAQTAGRLIGMNIISAGHSVSRELAEQHESEITALAIRKYRSKATEVAKQFGFGGYVVREISVQAGDSGGMPRPVMMQARAPMAMAADAPVPVEAGKTTLSVTVSGTVRLMP